MSSLANAIKRKTHKERSQPAARQRYGLLEKHKDYVERAKDFHKKEKTIKLLRRKAEERNPDEFYFGMEKARTKDGVHDGSLQRPNKYTAEELALMKSQDVKYLTHKERVEAEKIKSLQTSLHFLGAAPANSHVVFVEKAEEVATFNPATYFNTPKELLGRAFNRPRNEALTESGAVVAGGAHGMRAGARVKKAEKSKLAAYRELAHRVDRHAVLAKTAARLAYEKEVAGKGRKRKLSARELQKEVADRKRGTEEDEEGDGERSGSKGAVYKWKRERKK